MYSTSAGTKPNPLTDEDWKILLGRIKRGMCTPFLGAEASYGVLPARSDIAKQLADKYHYPLDDRDDLARVTQFIATSVDPLRPKEEILACLENIAAPDFTARDEPHRVLAELPLPVYVTTNYDDFMMRALTSLRSPKDPKRDFCRWNEILREEPSILDSGYNPTPANPVVFHIHGHMSVPPSLVLTEDDYLDFLMTSREPRIIPPRIQRAFTESWLLFLGYRLDDLEFRVLLRSLVSFLKRNLTRSHISVQFVNVDDTVSEEKKKQVTGIQEYLIRYCAGAPLYIRVYWGSTRDFVAELRQRWEAFQNGD